MEKTQVAIGNPLTSFGLTIVPVIQTRVYSWHEKGYPSIFCQVKPLYILISAAKSPFKAYDIEGTETAIDIIREGFPELQTAFNKIFG